MLILIIFATSYILRFLFDAWIADHVTVPNMTFAVVDVFTPIIFDIIPIALILFIHSRNFKTI